MNTTQTPDLMSTLVNILDTAEREVRTIIAQKIAPSTPIAETAPQSMTAAEYLAERDRINEWADYYRAIGDSEGARRCWAARCDLNDRYRVNRSTVARPH